MRASCCPDLGFFYIFPDLLPGFVRVWLRKEDTWMLKATSFTRSYQNHRNMTYDCYKKCSSHLLIKIYAMRYLTARSISLHFLPKSLKHDLFLLGTIPFRPPYQNHWSYNSWSKSLKYDTWLLQAISCTTPYQNQFNMTYCCYDLLLPSSKKYRLGWTRFGLDWFHRTSGTHDFMFLGQL